MENLGDYIYILFLAGAMIFSIVKKRKQKAVMQQMPDFSGNAAPEHYDDFEEEEPVGEHYQVPKPIPEPVRVMEANPIIRSQVTPRKPVATKVTAIAESEELQSINIDFSDTDELRKGIIFAEIFNRKY